MCKILKSTALLILFSTRLFAVQYWNDGFFADFGYSSGVGMKVPLEGTIGIRHSTEKFSYFGGIAFDGFATNITLSTLFEPLTIGVFSLGLKYSLHFGTSYTIPFLELDNNFYLSAIFRGRNEKVPVKTTISFGFDAKTTSQKLSNTSIYLFEFFPAFEIEVQVRFFKKQEFMFRFATFDTMRYKVWLNMWWQLGYSYDITNNITIAALFQITYADQITISGTVDGFQGKVAFIYKLK
ncbi:MAG: hypothetical protein ACRC5H_00690 [Treponemataceae bacterium]